MIFCGVERTLRFIQPVEDVTEAMELVRLSS
jgi:hypothetical protein